MCAQDIILDDVICTGEEESLNECDHNALYDHNCAHYEDVGVECYGRNCVTVFTKHKAKRGVLLEWCEMHFTEEDYCF